MTDFKAELKTLKQRHADRINAVRARLKVQNKELSAIKSAMKQGEAEGMTVPRIAEATGLPPDKVLWYVTALRKYGQAAEGEPDGGYFRYVPTANDNASDVET